MIHRRPEIDGDLVQELADLDALRRRLGAELRGSARWMGSLRRLVRARAVESSTSIEGFRLPLNQAQAIVAGDQAPEAGDIAEQAVACYGRAMDHVAAIAADPYFRWSERVLLDLHFDACYFQQDRSPGRWRQGPIYVRGPGAEIVYTAPEAEQVPALMAEVVDWLERGDLDVHVAVRAAMAHLHVVSIHPFRDGNGRVSRIVQSLVLAREGMVAPEFASIEEYLGAHTAEYYAALDKAHGPVYDPSRSVRGWIEFCLAAHLQQARARLSELETAAVRWNRCEELIRIRRWPDRLVIALEHALTGTLTNAGYRAEADVSETMARLDFRRLIDAGLIEQRGSGRSTAYVASEPLRAMIANEDLSRPASPIYPRINATTTPTVQEHPRTYRATVNPSSTSS